MARSHRHPAEPHRRVGHAVRDADRAPARRRRGRGGSGTVGRRPQHVLPGLPGASSTPTRRSRTGRASGWSLLQGGDGTTLRLWRTLVEGSKEYFLAVYEPPGRPADRGRLLRGELLQRPAAVRRRRAGQAGPSETQRGRAVRVPGRLQQPRRRSAAADRAEVRRRFRLRGYRPGHDPAAHPAPARHAAALRRWAAAAPAPGDGLPGRPGRRMARPAGAGRARRLRLDPRLRRQDATDAAPARR